jgi:hypothetical protein
MINRPRTPIAQGISMPDIYHVNFRTIRHLPIFLEQNYAATLNRIVDAIVERHRIHELARAIMPTHLHVVVTITGATTPRSGAAAVQKTSPLFDAKPAVQPESRLIRLAVDRGAADFGGPLSGEERQLIDASRPTRRTACGNRILLGARPVAARGVPGRRRVTNPDYSGAARS